MKSTHLLSSVHDLAICTRSAQTLHKKRFRHDSDCRLIPLGRVFSTDRMYRAAVQSILADLVSAITPSAIWFSPEPGSIELTFFFLGRRHAASTVSLCRLQSSEIEFTIGPPDNTARSAMTMPTQIQNQPLVSHMFHAFHRNTRQSFAASATAGRLATNHELQPIGGRRGVPFKSVIIRFRSTILVPMSASLCVPDLARTSTTPSAHNYCSNSSRASKWRTRPTPRLVAIARPADASVSHTTLNVIPYSTIALRTSRA